MCVVQAPEARYPNESGTLRQYPIWASEPDRPSGSAMPLLWVHAEIYEVAGRTRAATSYSNATLSIPQRAHAHAAFRGGVGGCRSSLHTRTQ